MPSRRVYTLSVPGNALRLEQELRRNATLSSTPSVLFGVSIVGVSATVVRDVDLVSPSEILAEEAVVAAHVGTPGEFVPIYLCEDPYLKGRKVLDQWFESDDGDGSYSGLSYSVAYEYSGNRLISVVTSYFYKDGTIRHSTTMSFHTTDNNNRVTKVTTAKV